MLPPCPPHPQDGDGSGTSAVTDSDCGAGFSYNPTASAAKCAGAACDMGVAGDKAACCVAKADPSAGSDTIDTNTIIIIAGAVLAVVAIGAGVLVCKRRQSHKKNEVVVGELKKQKEIQSRKAIEVEVVHE